MCIKIFFPRLSRGTVCLLADREKCLESTRSTILEPLEFTVYVTRNISAPSMHFPNVDVQLGLGDVEVWKEMGGNQLAVTRMEN